MPGGSSDGSERRAPLDQIPRVGSVIAGGKYRVDEICAIGGMGVVVSATHLHLGQKVAIKFLLPEATQVPGAVQRFLAEARAAAALANEHVVRIYDVDVLDSGLPYIVMEFLDGHDLGQLIADRRPQPIPVPEALDYVLQACEGIAAAHSAGIVHRDLKPANLFVTRRTDGTHSVKVLDFGLVKATGRPDVAKDLTAASAVMGTPQYMSPEQVRSSREVDRRTDIWSLGVILYELLGGRLPFDGESSTAVCAQIAADPYVPLRTLRPEVTADLEAAVNCCLEKDPARRCESVADLAEWLLPFAPRRSSKMAVERILITEGRMDGEGKATPRPLPSVRPVGIEQAPTVMSTPAATVRDMGPAAARRRLRGVVAIGFVVLAVLLTLGYLWLGRWEGEPASAQTGTGAPATAAPSTVGPVTAAPVPQTPAPETATPETAAPETAAPETTRPEDQGTQRRRRGPRPGTEQDMDIRLER